MPTATPPLAVGGSPALFLLPITSEVLEARLTLAVMLQVTLCTFVQIAVWVDRICQNVGLNLTPNLPLSPPGATPGNPNGNAVRQTTPYGLCSFTLGSPTNNYPLRPQDNPYPTFPPNQLVPQDDSSPIVLQACQPLEIAQVTFAFYALGPIYTGLVHISGAVEYAGSLIQASTGDSYVVGLP